MANLVYWYDSMWKFPEDHKRTVDRVLTTIVKQMYQSCQLEHEGGITILNWGHKEVPTFEGDISKARCRNRIVTQCYEGAFWSNRNKPKLVILASFILGDVERLINDTIRPQGIPFIRYTRSARSTFSRETLGSGYIQKPNVRTLSREIVYWLKS